MVAVKKIIEPFHDRTDCKRLLREIRLLRSLRHPNVLHLRDLMPPPSFSSGEWKDVYLVTRLFDTNLHRVIYSGQLLSDAHVQYILWQIFRALRYMHAAGVVHRADDVFFWERRSAELQRGWAAVSRRAAAACAGSSVDERRPPLWASSS